jgi:hypothetical protein
MTDLEKNKINQLAKEYRKKGYKVYINPSYPAALPSFLENYQPDLLAKKGREYIIVEVKSSLTLSRANYLENLARAIENHEGWRLELVVTNPIKDKITEEIEGEYATLSLTDIEKRLNDIRNLTNQKFVEASFLLAWATTEAVMRHTLLIAGLDYREKRPVANIKTLYSYGLLDKSDYELLLSLNKNRNIIAHGFKPPKYDFKTTNTLVRIITKLIKISNSRQYKDNKQE